MESRYFYQKLKKGLYHKNAVLIKGYGAVCIGKTKGDIKASQMILEKSCRAALYARAMKQEGRGGQIHRLKWLDAWVQRGVYQMKYAKKGSICEKT